VELVGCLRVRLPVPHAAAARNYDSPWDRFHELPTDHACLGDDSVPAPESRKRRSLRDRDSGSSDESVKASWVLAHECSASQTLLLPDLSRFQGVRVPVDVRFPAISLRIFCLRWWVCERTIDWKSGTHRVISPASTQALIAGHSHAHGWYPDWKPNPDSGMDDPEFDPNLAQSRASRSF
jgi:hypothetical protein